jgi:exonuclease SbcD
MGKKFRFIHVADTHNGHSGNASRFNEFKALRIDKTTDSGINIRQHDIDMAFKGVIDIAIEQKVDAVIHAGDGWDFWGYKQPYVANNYMGQIARLASLGIDYLEIVGNHNLPKKAGVGCFLEQLNILPRVHTVYKGLYEPIELEPHNVVVHCVPSSFTQDMLREELALVGPVSGKINIGVGHFGVTTIKHYAEQSANALVVDLDQLIQCKMDYFALGDYHHYTDFGNHIYYSGSTERMGFGEMDVHPSVSLVEIDQDTHEVSVKRLYLKVREMIELPMIDAKGKTIEQLQDLIEKTLQKSTLDEKIVRLRIKNLPVHLKRLINELRIRELTKDALYFKLEFPDKVNATKVVRESELQFEGIIEGWGSFSEGIEEDGTFDKKTITNLGFRGLREVLDHETASSGVV